MELGDLQRARLRELLARLDRIATVSRGHRAGLHLDDHSLVDQYVAVLMAWEGQIQAQPRPGAQTTVSADTLIGAQPMPVRRT
jgi:hypothetical protein